MPVRAVIDTNIVVSALISPRGTPDAIVRALRRSAFQLVVSHAVLAEYEAVPSRPRLARRFKLSDGDVPEFLRLLLYRADLVNPAAVLPLTVRDAKDRHLLMAALGGNAGYLVSGDLDLLTLDGDPALGSLKIVKPRAFLLLLGPHSNGHGSL